MNTSPDAGARIVIMGPPGSGKGTHAAGLAQRFGVPEISTGDLFRSLSKEPSERGAGVARTLESGDFVPDELTDTVVTERLAEDDARSGFVLDGYPRTVAQVAALDAALAREGVALDLAVVLHIDEEEIERRLTARAEQEGRSDDTPQTIRHRVSVYERETVPIEELYSARGILVPVDGTGSADDVAERIASIDLASDSAPSSER